MMTDDSGLPDHPQKGPSFPLALGAGAAVAIAMYPLLGAFGSFMAGGTAFFAVGLVRPGYSPVRPLAWGLLVGATFATGILAPDPFAHVSYAAGAILLFAGVLLPSFRDRWLRPSGAPPEGLGVAERGTVSDERMRLALVNLLHQWRRAEVTEGAVRDEAEHLLLGWDGWSQWKSTPRGAEPPRLQLLVEVAASLGSLQDRWIVEDDIAPMLEALDLLPSDPAAAEQRWVGYRDSIDWEARRQALQDHAFYRT